MNFNTKKKIIIIFLILVSIFILCLYYYFWNPDSYHKPRVIIVGIDGAQWDIISSLIRKGKLPNFKRIQESGASGKVYSIPFPENSKYATPFLSPIIWTSIATSRKPKEHGILDFVINEEMAGSIHRKVPAMWNILSFYNKKLAIIGWHATYPAEEVNGYLISSKLGLWGYKISANIPIAKYHWSEEKIIYPPLFMKELKGKILDNYFDVESFIDKNIFGPECEAYKYAIEKSIYYAIIYQDEIYYRILTYLLDKEDFDLAAVYFDGIDHNQHRLWKYCNNEAFKEINMSYYPECTKENPIENYYSIIDERIGKIYDKYADKYTIILVSDHGGQHWKYSHQINIEYYLHSHEAIFFIAGQGIKKNYQFKSGTYNLYDILPTVLYILNLPMSKEFEGKVIKDIFKFNFLLRNKRHLVNKYGIEMQQEHKFKKDDIDKELIEKLKGLGYVK